MSSSKPAPNPTLLPARRRALADASRSAPGQRRPPRAAPLLVLVVIGSLGVRLATHAWRDQDYAGMFAALAILSMVAFMVWRRGRSRR
jgi:protein-S-isoprenylcysteine O-methyltransferase Ste14